MGSLKESRTLELQILYQGCHKVSQLIQGKRTLPFHMNEGSAIDSDLEMPGLVAAVEQDPGAGKYS